MECVVLDLETTGLSARRDRITEIAAVKLNNNKVIDSFQTLINPNRHIPSFITRLTGISDDMVKDAPLLRDVVSQLMEFMGNTTMVAHNATFDYGFLHHHLLEYDYEFLNSTLCTRKLANRIHPELQSKTLASLCSLYKVQNQQAHRAMSDVLATVDVFKGMRKRLASKGIKSQAEILSFERLPRYKAAAILHNGDKL